jgi:hypothetical protein
MDRTEMRASDPLPIFLHIESELGIEDSKRRQIRCEEWSEGYASKAPFIFLEPLNKVDEQRS